MIAVTVRESLGSMTSPTGSDGATILLVTQAGCAHYVSAISDGVELAHSESHIIGKFNQMTISGVSRTSVRSDYTMRGSSSDGWGVPMALTHPSRIGKKLAEK